jgi:hypothetical protein
MRLMKAAPLLALLALFIATPAAAQNCEIQNRDLGLLTMTAQGAATLNSADQINCTGRGVVVVVDLTTVTTATVTVTIQGKDAVSGKYYTLLASAGLTGVGTTPLVVYPAAAVTTNLSANSPLPRTWRVSVGVVGGSAAVTGKIGASVIE